MRARSREKIKLLEELEQKLQDFREPDEDFQQSDDDDADDDEIVDRVPAPPIAKLAALQEYFAASRKEREESYLPVRRALDNLWNPER